MAPVTRKYIVHRSWKAVPKGRGNGNQVDDLTVRLLANPLAKGPADAKYGFLLSVLQFEGKDLDGSETKHLKEVAPIVQKNKMSRIFKSLGPTSVWKMTTSNDAGWAGMMADKSLGLFDIGFLDVVFPEEPVHIGSRWARDIPFGDELLYRNGKPNPEAQDVKGGIAHCIFELRNFSLKSKTAAISFSGSSVTTMKNQSIFGSGRGTERIIEKQSGKWVVNVETGLVLSFHAKRTKTELYDDKTTIETTVTNAVISK
jgi:hypothetical protein